MARDKIVALKICLDVILLLTVGLPILIYHLHGKPFERGFFCDDDSIKFPLKPSTISSTVLYIVGVFLPITVISLNEFAGDARSKKETRGRIYMFLGKPVPYVVWRLYRRIGVFLFGACMSQLTTDIAKYSIGRLRPHFLDVCHPRTNCSLVSDPYKYIENADCMGNDATVIREARLSFPSGHSSFSAYTMVFTVIYLQACMQCNVNRLLKPFLQFLLLMMTWYTGLSRVSDFKHHWSDVLGGFVIGITVAIITTWFLSDFYKPPKKPMDDITLHSLSVDAQVTSYNTMNASEIQHS